jgi:hypothetical protein
MAEFTSAMSVAIGFPSRIGFEFVGAKCQLASVPEMMHDG